MAIASTTSVTMSSIQDMTTTKLNVKVNIHVLLVLAGTVATFGMTSAYILLFLQCSVPL